MTGSTSFTCCECADRIELYTQLGRDAFLADPKTQDAVIRNFEIIGEAAKRVSAATQILEPGIPWERIAGFRDVLIHRYKDVDLELVWRRVEEDLPHLQENLKRLLHVLERELAD